MTPRQSVVWGGVFTTVFVAGFALVFYTLMWMIETYGKVAIPLEFWAKITVSLVLAVFVAGVVGGLLSKGR